MESSENNNQNLLAILEKRFNENLNRHESLNWKNIEEQLKSNPDKLEILLKMEETGGEPDVVKFDKNSGKYLFIDCSPESPKGRRSFCYDAEALEKRKENKPKDSAINAAKSMGIEILTDEDYRYLQTFGAVDTKTSSWIETPPDIRKHGGAIFGDYRYGTVFIYHNGADSYYAARGFRGKLWV